MTELGKLALVATNSNETMVQIYRGVVTIHTGEPTKKKSFCCRVDDEETISEIIKYLKTNLMKEEKQDEP